MKDRVVLDVSALPPHASGTASLTFWGTSAYMLIEGMGFALAIAVYLYLMSIAVEWPLGAPKPDLAAGLIQTALLLASVAPNLLLSRWAKKHDLRKVQWGLVVMSALGILSLIVRVFEFPAMNVKWDTNAYGSVVWLILGLHTSHVITDLVDTFVLTALMFTRHGDNARRYGDVEDNVMYWNFVVIAWIPLYACLYWIPRL